MQCPDRFAGSSVEVHSVVHPQWAERESVSETHAGGVAHVGHAGQAAFETDVAGIYEARDLQVLDDIKIALFLLIGKRHPHDQDQPCDSAQ